MKYLVLGYVPGAELRAQRLTQEGYEAVVANNPEEARRLIFQDEVDGIADELDFPWPKLPHS